MLKRTEESGTEPLPAEPTAVDPAGAPKRPVPDPSEFLSIRDESTPGDWDGQTTTSGRNTLRKLLDGLRWRRPDRVEERPSSDGAPAARHHAMHEVRARGTTEPGLASILVAATRDAPAGTEEVTVAAASRSRVRVRAPVVALVVLVLAALALTIALVLQGSHGPSAPSLGTAVVAASSLPVRPLPGIEAAPPRSSSVPIVEPPPPAPPPKLPRPRSTPSPAAQESATAQPPRPVRASPSSASPPQDSTPAPSPKLDREL